MHKNHNHDSVTPTRNLDGILSRNHINSVLYSDPFLKAGFITRLVDDTKIDVLYLDLDLLYSGYVTSGIIPMPKNVTLYQPTADTITHTLTKLLVRASTSCALVIVDSINGLFNILNRKKDVGRLVASIIMLIASIGRITNSTLLLSCMVRYKKEEGWVLSPTGKRLIETKDSKRILLKQEREGIVINFLDDSRNLLLASDSILL